MSEASASAMLVGTPEMLDERPDAVTTTLPRSEIGETLAADPPADWCWRTCGPSTAGPRQRSGR